MLIYSSNTSNRQQRVWDMFWSSFGYNRIEKSQMICGPKRKKEVSAIFMKIEFLVPKQYSEQNARFDIGHYLDNVWKPVKTRFWK